MDRSTVRSIRNHWLRESKCDGVSVPKATRQFSDNIIVMEMTGCIWTDEMEFATVAREVLAHYQDDIRFPVPAIEPAVGRIRHGELLRYLCRRSEPCARDWKSAGAF